MVKVTKSVSYAVKGLSLKNSKINNVTLSRNEHFYHYLLTLVFKLTSLQDDLFCNASRRFYRLLSQIEK